MSVGGVNARKWDKSDALRSWLKNTHLEMSLIKDEQKPVNY